MSSDLMNPAQCNICKTAAAHFYCNTCGDALCAKCKVHHLRSKASSNHVIVPYAEKLNPSFLAGVLCPKHQTHGPKFWCNTCSVPICDYCIVTNEHQGHQYSDITNALSERRDAMLEEMKMLRDKIVVEWEEELKQAKRITAVYQNSIDDFGDELVAWASEMHKQVDNILATSQNTLQQIKTTGMAKLQQQEKYLADRLQQLKADVTRYENTLCDAEPNELLQFKQDPSKSQDSNKSPALETASLPVFLKGQIDTKAMQNMFGQISAEAILKKSDEVANKPASLPSPQPASSSETQRTKALSVSESSHSARSRATGPIIPNPSVKSQFKTIGYYDPCIACVSQGLAWVKTGISMRPKSTILQLVDRDRFDIKDTINPKFFVDDMAITSDGNLILLDLFNRCIRSVSKQKFFTTLFKTREQPCSLLYPPQGRNARKSAILQHRDGIWRKCICLRAESAES